MPALQYFLNDLMCGFMSFFLILLKYIWFTFVSYFFVLFSNLVWLL